MPPGRRGTTPKQQAVDQWAGCGRILPIFLVRREEYYTRALRQRRHPYDEKPEMEPDPDEPFVPGPGDLSAGGARRGPEHRLLRPGRGGAGLRRRPADPLFHLRAQGVPELLHPDLGAGLPGAWG